MKKHKVLLFIKTPPPVTGATLMNQRVHDSQILRSTFDVRAICISYMQKRSDMGRWRLSKLFMFINVYINLLKELIRNRPGLVYFQLSPHGIALVRDSIFVFTIKLFSVRILFHLRGKGIYEKSKKKLWKLFYKEVFSNTEVICLSKLLKYDIKNVFNERIHIVPNGIPDDKDDISQNNTIKERMQILFLSNLIYSKGIMEFLDAIKLISGKHPDIKALIVGAEGDLNEKTLIKEVKDRGLNNIVTYLGPKYGREKAIIITNIDIFIFPTKNDIWGNVLLELMIMGKPVVAAKEGATPEIVDDGVTGFLVDKSSPEQIAEKTQILIENPELRKSMGIAARKKYEEKYTLSVFEEKMRSVFQEVIDNQNNK